MNNNIQRITKQITQTCKEYISQKQYSQKQINKLLIQRPIDNIRISQDALDLCLQHNVLPYDYFILTESELRKKYKNFFKSNEKTLKNQHAIGHYLTGDHNIPNKAVIETMIKLYETNPNTSADSFRKILNEQSYDLITLEENKKLDETGLKFKGTKQERDNLCSKKIEITDLWLTPQQVIDDFFTLTGLNKDECLDPCASDGRWLQNKGLSLDILPMTNFVKQKDFLTLTKAEVPKNIKYIVGNLPFSLLDKFVEKSLELVDECYFLVNGDTIFQHFPDNIKHLYIFSGLEGNQKDNRSRCEFDVPFLRKSALWCCIVHITKEKQKAWNIEHDISNETKRDGNHIAVGRNTFINCNKNVDEDERVSRIFVKSEIKYKKGKKIIVDDKEIDLKNLSSPKL